MDLFETQEAIVARDYQVEQEAACLEEFKTVQSTLCVAATGTGKSVLAKLMAKDMVNRGRIVVIVHRKELMLQMADHMKSVGLTVDVEMGDQQADLSMFTRSQVVVTSVQTQVAGCEGNGRMTRFDPNKFSFAIVDECHHAVAPSFRKVLDYYRQNPSLKMLGLTATPDRQDEKALGQIFDSVAHCYDVRDAIADGWLVPIAQKSVYVEDMDLAQIGTSMGDLNGRELAEVMEMENILHRIVHPTLELSNGRKTLCFATRVSHAERLAEIFNRHEAGSARFVFGKMPAEERASVFRDYRADKFRILVNVGIVTEGVDIAGIEVVSVARPTKSRALYAQMIGRATRPLQGLVDPFPTAEERRAAIAASAKPHALVLDFHGNAGRHKLITPADILGGDVDDDVVQKAKELLQEAEEESDVTAAIEEAEELVREERERKCQLEQKKRSKIKGKNKFTVKPVDILASWDIDIPKERGWDAGRVFSQKQSAMLEKMGVDPAEVSFLQGKKLIDAQFDRIAKNLCTYKQARRLKMIGYPDANNATMNEAKYVMTYLARNRWFVQPGALPGLVKAAKERR